MYLIIKSERLIILITHGLLNPLNPFTREMHLISQAFYIAE